MSSIPRKMAVPPAILPVTNTHLSLSSHEIRMIKSSRP
jgi:hypothetical protein